nr:MAG TPA: hypothetical protein [Caudoviricetes sp.]
MYFHEVTSNFLSPVRGYAGRERASSTSAPPFTKLLIIFSQEALRMGCLLRCVAKGS